MSVYVSEQLRKAVTQRAKHLCEYCLFHEGDALNTFHIEHIIPLKHNGKTILSNLAYACPFFYYCMLEYSLSLSSKSLTTLFQKISDLPSCIKSLSVFPLAGIA